MDTSDSDVIYSPVEVPESPVAKKAHGNLTGNVRKVRDCVADLYNYTQNWNDHFLRGATLLQEIVVSNTPSSRSEEQQITHYEQLQRYFNELKDITNKLKDIVENLETLCRHLQGVRKLESRNKSVQPLFLTWDAPKFEEISTRITEAYRKELKLKTYVEQNIGHTTEVDKANVLLYLWLHQPYIDDNVTLDLEAMLKETGHR